MSHQPQPATYRLGDPSSYACAWWCHGWCGLINGQPKQRALGKGRSLHIGAGPVQESFWTMLCLTPPLVDQIAMRTIGVPMGVCCEALKSYGQALRQLADRKQDSHRLQLSTSIAPSTNGPTGPNQRFQGSMAQVLGFLWICYLNILFVSVSAAPCSSRILEWYDSFLNPLKCTLGGSSQDPTKLTTLDDWFFKTEPKKDKVPHGCLRCHLSHLSAMDCILPSNTLQRFGYILVVCKLMIVNDS